MKLMQKIYLLVLGASSGNCDIKVYDENDHATFPWEDDDSIILQ